jgi:hypothetical protein
MLGGLFFEIPANKEHGNDRSDQQANEVIHLPIFSCESARNPLLDLWCD